MPLLKLRFLPRRAQRANAKFSRARSGARHERSRGRRLQRLVVRLLVESWTAWYWGKLRPLNCYGAVGVFLYGKSAAATTRIH